MENDIEKSEDNLFECNVCFGISFMQARSLKRHIHECHKNFKCNSCGKSFTRAYSLNIHIKTIHKGHKDFKCDSCGKSFKEASNLRKHIIKVIKILNVNFVLQHFLQHTV